MEKKEIIVQFINHRTGKEMDIEVPLDITANELIHGLNEGLGLHMASDNMFQNSLSAENPIVLLRGTRTLAELGLRDGSVIHYS